MSYQNEIRCCPIISIRSALCCIRFEATWPSASLYMEGNPTKKAWSRETPKKQSFVIVVLNKIAFPPLFLSYRVDTGRQCLKILVGSKEEACFTDAISKNQVILWWLFNQNEKVEKQVAFVFSCACYGASTKQRRLQSWCVSPLRITLALILKFYRLQHPSERTLVPVADEKPWIFTLCAYVQSLVR